jgi:hypothetical protein
MFANRADFDAAKKAQESAPTETEREQFEALAKARSLELDFFKHKTGFVYDDEITRLAWEFWQAATRQAIPAGWKLVPIEPTGKMVIEGLDIGIDAGKIRKIYQYMLNAAPKE